MASKSTASKALRILKPVAELLDPLQMGMAGIDSKGNLVKDVNGRTFGKGSVNQGILPLLYKELPKATLRRFILVGAGETAPPTADEWAAFKRRLLCLVRRILNRKISKILEKLPPDIGRPERTRKEIKLFCETVKRYQMKGMSKTAAVRQTAKNFSCTEMTVWNHLRQAKANRGTMPGDGAAKPADGGHGPRSQTGTGHPTRASAAPGPSGHSGANAHKDPARDSPGELPRQSPRP